MASWAHYTVKCHYNACHYNANASLTRSILGSQTAPTCPHDHPRVAQHMGKRCEIIAVWSATVAMTPLCSHTNEIKQRYPTCWLCQYNRFTFFVCILWRTHDNFDNDLSNQKFHRSFWLMGFKVGETERDCESGSMLHYRNKINYWKQLFYSVMYSVSTSPRLLWTTQSYWLSYRLGLHVTSTCVYKTQSWYQVPESGDTFLQSAFLRPFTIVWGKPQSSNLPISCFKI